MTESSLDWVALEKEQRAKNVFNYAKIMKRNRSLVLRKVFSGAED
jgi:hypothetical protein